MPVKTKHKIISLKDFQIANNTKFCLIAGPCALEGKNMAIDIALRLKEITEKLNINFIFKASFDKANRTSYDSLRGLGLDKSIEVFDIINNQHNIPCLTDIHEKGQANKLLSCIDIFQVPAFLSRQTDLIVEIAKTNKIINIKKAQFMSPNDVKFAAQKAAMAGNAKILLTERGYSFGYNNLVVDFRSIEIMKETGYAIIMDATHSVQLPGLGGESKYAHLMAKLGLTCGIAGVFIETHPNPKKAISDGDNMIALDEMPLVLEQLVAYDNLTKANLN